MGWRVIVRLSLNRDTQSVIRNQVVKPVLEAAGLIKRRRSTATWESQEADEVKVARQLARLLRRLARAANEAGANPKVVLDHIWIYIDQARRRPS
jgi:hypothetical protein